MIRIKDIGIEEYKRSEDDPNKICHIKINGQWKEYKMTSDEYGWLIVIMPLESGTYQISLLDIDIMLGRIKPIA